MTKVNKKITAGAVFVPFPMFNMGVYISVGETDEVFKNKLMKVSKKLPYFEQRVEFEEIINTLSLFSIHADGYTAYNTNFSTVYIRVKEKLSYKTIPVLVHECIHAVNRIFEIKGVKADNTNDELLAYSVDHCVEQVLKGFGFI